METAFSNVYTNHLSGQEMIHHLSKYVYQRKLMLLKDIPDLTFRLDKQYLEIKEGIRNYEQSESGSEEKSILKNFKATFESIPAVEHQIKIASNELTRQRLLKLHEELTDTLLVQLQQLSKVELQMAEQLNHRSKKISGNEILLNQFNWALIAIIGITIQAMLFTSKSAIPRFPQNEWLN